MPRTKSFDEDVVLDRAAQLFRERGYEGTSLADLESHLGLGRQSLYNSFGDKQALFLRALDRYRQTVGDCALAGLNAPDAGLEEIRAFFDQEVAALTGVGDRKTCLEVNTILERGSGDADALLRCNQSRSALERVLRRALTKAKRTGKLHDTLDVESTATLLVIQHYGLNVMAKTGATAAEMRAAVEALFAGLR